MRLHTKHETEPIFATLDRYRAELLEHPLLVAARTGQIERPMLLRSHITSIPTPSRGSRCWRR